MSDNQLVLALMATIILATQGCGEERAVASAKRVLALCADPVEEK